MAKDESGFDTDPIELGRSLAETLGKVTLEYADIIRDHITKALNSPEYATDASRAGIQKTIVAEVEQIKAERGNNVNDEVYRRFLDGGKQAIKVLRREN